MGYFWHTILILSSVILVVKLLLNYYWKVQMMYNSESLSFYTNPSFSISNENNLLYYTTLGEQKAKESRIIITTLLRDVNKNILAIKKKSEAVGNMFQDYRILIVENNSSDGTRESLLKWSRENPKIIILGCGVNAAKCNIEFAKDKTMGHSVNRGRIDKMTHLRNIYIKYIKASDELKQFDYTVVWDLDVIGTSYLDGIANSIGHFAENPNIKVLTAYGVYRWGYLLLYYDTYAHLDYGDKFELKFKPFHDFKKGLGVRGYRGDELREVVSAFGGFSIYRTNVLLDPHVYYDLSPTENIECEHVRLHKRIGKGIYMNPSMINYILLNE